MARPITSPLASVIVSYFRAKHDLRPLSVRTYRLAFARFLAILGDTPTLADLAPDQVNRYLASIADHRTMAHNDCAAIMSLASWCVRAGLLAQHPLAGVMRPRAPRSRPRPHDERIVPAIVAAATAMGPRDRALILLSLATGARPNEIRQLTLADLDLGERLVHIRAATSKTDDGDRYIPLSPQAVAALDEYIADYRPDVDGPLFLTTRGQGFTYLGFTQIHYRLRDRLRRQGVLGYTAYANRHSGLTNLARVPGITIADLQYLAGHRDVTTTRKYIAPRRPRDLARLPDALTLAYGRLA